MTDLNSHITEIAISQMVEQFYEKVFAHERLGPIFRAHISVGHAVHLKTMKKFWRSVLLKTGEYKGRPLPAHQRINGVDTGHFEDWLFLFRQTLSDLFPDDVSAEILVRAERIATSLWLARNPDPFQSPPDWKSSQGLPETSNFMQKGDVSC